MNYGLPYKGSKNYIAQKIVGFLPAGGTLVDLFCGGGAITHCAMLSGKWSRFIINDLDSGIVKLFVDSVNGKLPNTGEWISRDAFFERKDSEPWIACCYSFGNNCRDYLYSRKIEPYKRACHLAIVNDEWNELGKLCPEIYDEARIALENLKDRKQRRLAFGPAVVRRLREINNPILLANPLYASCQFKGYNRERLQSLERLERLERLQSLESLERLERLQSLESLERLEAHSVDYREVPIPDGAIVYADPPYKGTSKYSCEFESEAFWDWVRTRRFPVYVSEYDAPPDFVPKFESSKRCSMSATKNLFTVEKIFVHKRFQTLGEIR